MVIFLSNFTFYYCVIFGNVLSFSYKEGIFMRLTISKSKNSICFYIIKSVTINGKRTSKVIQKLGNLEEVKLKANGEDPYLWAKKQVDKLTAIEKENNSNILIQFSQTKKMEKNKQLTFNGGYLFLQKIYYELGLPKICNEIKNKYQIKYDLNSILSRLIFGRIIYPSSKLATLEYSKTFIEQPNFELHQIYRALEIISKENDFIQSELYKNSCKCSKRNNKVLYYDCTNYFFEIDQEDGLKQYGISKENRPNPITQMGLFMDGDGIPLAFNINPGNTNEQETLTPLEEKIIKDFELATFVVCTDAGLSSIDNRKFNNKDGRKFITTQSVKKLKKYLKNWILDKTGWYLPDIIGKTFDISKLETNDELANKFKDKIFFKERWINEDGLEQKIIVTYSIKYRDYQRKVRDNQIQRAQKLIDSNPKKIGKPKQNDFKRFIYTLSTTKDGELAEEFHYGINQEIIEKEKMYDGYYAVCTNLDDSPEDIIKVNKRRWEIEESFRIMKSEFKSRPVYLSRDDRIKAHFMTCFLALIIFRFLEKKLNEKYTVCEIIETLKDFNFREISGFGYLPLYKLNNIIEDLHTIFSINTDFEFITEKNMKKILNSHK